MLFCLATYSRPDLCNVVKELSKCREEATIGASLELLMVIKLFIDAKHICLRIQPEVKFKYWSLRVFFDSDWAGDSESRISTTDLIVYLMNVPVC
jgi:hypothetical protein